MHIIQDKVDWSSLSSYKTVEVSRLPMIVLVLKKTEKGKLVCCEQLRKSFDDHFPPQVY